MYWIMLTERKSEKESKLIGIPKSQNLECNQGEFILGQHSLIEYDIEKDDNFDYPNDSLVAPGFKGLLVHKKVSEILNEIDVNNIQTFPVLLKEVDTEKSNDNYELVNIVGTADIVDYNKSQITMYEPGDIDFIDSLSFIDTSEIKLPYVFRLSSFLPLIIAHDRVKKVFEENKVTGFNFYKPEDFSL